MKLNEKIIYYRKKCGLSQEELGEKIGVSRQAVSKWETGDALPEVTKLKALANVFGVTVDFLLDDDEPIQKKENEETVTAQNLGIHSTGNDTASRFSLFAKRYAWIGGIALMAYGTYRTIVGFIGLINIFGTLSIVNVGSAVSAGVIAMLTCGLNIAVGIALIIAGKFIYNKFKQNPSSDKKIVRSGGIIMMIVGIVILLIAAIIAVNAFGDLDIIRLIPNTLPTSLALVISVLVLAVAILLIILGSKKLKKSKLCSD